jgi:hypothetical protein
MRALMHAKQVTHARAAVDPGHKEAVLVASSCICAYPWSSKSYLGSEHAELASVKSRVSLTVTGASLTKFAQNYCVTGLYSLSHHATVCVVIHNVKRSAIRDPRSRQRAD